MKLSDAVACCNGHEIPRDQVRSIVVDSGIDDRDVAVLTVSRSDPYQLGETLEIKLANQHLFRGRIVGTHLRPGHPSDLMLRGMSDNVVLERGALGPLLNGGRLPGHLVKRMDLLWRPSKERWTATVVLHDLHATLYRVGQLASVVVPGRQTPLEGRISAVQYSIGDAPGVMVRVQEQ